MRLTIVSLDLAACSSVVVFCTNALLLLKLDGKACGEEYVVVGRFSYADCQHAPVKFQVSLDSQEAGSRRPHE